MIKKNFKFKSNFLQILSLTEEGLSGEQPRSRDRVQEVRQNAPHIHSEDTRSTEGVGQVCLKGRGMSCVQIQTELKPKRSAKTMLCTPHISTFYRKFWFCVPLLQFIFVLVGTRPRSDLCTITSKATFFVMLFAFSVIFSL